jgi:sugar phosphate isomerase/epimerase
MERLALFGNLFAVDSPGDLCDTLAMNTPIALQLYTVRAGLKDDFEGVVRQIAEIGYTGVEPFDSAAIQPAVAGRLFAELGLAVPGAHTALPLGENERPVLEAMAAYGCRRLVSGYLGQAYFQTADGVRRACEQFNQANQVALANGLTFGIHNHWWEFEQVDGRYAYEIMLEELDPDIFFEIDTYWVKTAGLDPTAVIRQLGSRVPLLHVKDGPAVLGEPMTAVGQGTLDFHEITAAAEGYVEWLIVELDECATNMMEAVAQSYHYLTREGLGRGNR